MRFHCCSETYTPCSILVHEPGEETRLAVQDPNFWGFDPSLEKDPRSFDKWLEDAKKEHQAFVSVLRNEGILVKEVQDLLNERLEELREYICNQFKIVLERCGSFEKDIQHAVLDAQEPMLESPVNGVLLWIGCADEKRVLLKFQMKNKLEFAVWNRFLFRRTYLKIRESPFDIG